VDCNTKSFEGLDFVVIKKGEGLGSKYKSSTLRFFSVDDGCSIVCFSSFSSFKEEEEEVEAFFDSILFKQNNQKKFFFFLSQ
jgi:hypothetical protein